MKKGLFLLMLVFLGGIIFSLPAEASWQEAIEEITAYQVPLPAATKEAQQEKAQLAGGDFLIKIYTSDLSFAEIAKFYQTRLAQNGWEDISKHKRAEAVAGSDYFKNTLIFKKGQELLTIQNLQASGKNTTSFSISKGRPAFLKSPEEQAVVNEVEFKDIPVYPNGKLYPLSSIQTAGRKQVAYVTADNLDTVIQFYRRELSAVGWQIVDELPVIASSEADLKDYPQIEKLPVPADVKKAIKGSSMRMEALQAKKGKETCTIGVSEIDIPASSRKQTTISINCLR